MKFSEFKKAFVNKRTDKKDLIKRIKLSLNDYDSLENFISSFEKELKPFKSLLNNTILGKHYLPTNYNNLNQSEKQYFSNNIISELNWQVFAFLKSSEKINSFLTLKDFFEKELLLANYSNARIILEKIETEISVSFWSLENRFILDELQFGTEKNWETRNLILNDNNQLFVQILGNMFSVKSEKKVSFFQYNEELNTWFDLQGINNGEYEDLIEYIRYKVNYFSINNYEYFNFILFRETTSSIIDRYLTSVKILYHLISNGIDKERDKALILIKKLNKQINDRSLENTLFIFDNDFEAVGTDNEIINVIDLYSSGNYVEAFNTSKKLILNDFANSIEVYEIYTKSLIESGDDFSPITNEDSIANQIANKYYNVLSKNNDTDDSLIELLNLSYIFNNSHIGLQLYSFVSYELGWNNDIDYTFLGLLSSKIYNPKILYKLINNKEESHTFIKRLNKSYKRSSTVNLFKEYLENHYNNTVLVDYKNIPNNKNQLYKIRNLIQKNNYINSIIEYENLIIHKQAISIIAYYECLSNLFQCYLIENMYRNSIKLFVDTHLYNSHLTKKMDSKELLDIIIANKYKNIGDKNHFIELPIFFKINCKDKIKIKQTYELFLNNNKCIKPSEIISKIDNFENGKFIFFLRNVCIIEIMQLSKSFESTYEVNEERIEICKFLSNIDSDNISSYKSEIADLTKKNTISKVIGGIDERKIFVNESKLRLSLQNIHKQNVLQNEQISPLNRESYDRYMDILNFVKNNNEYKDANSFIESNKSNDDILNSYLESIGIYVFNYTSFRTFCMFFLHIRDLFVFNKEFGLDAYLSTRIRHGTLPNHLRSVFENYSLVTSQTNYIYSENQFWKDKINLPDESMKILQTAFSNFSLEIDNYSKKIKDIHIQCKSEERNIDKKALFDYSYTEETLILIFIKDFQNNEDFNNFIDKIFNELWKRTETNLEQIRKLFNNEFRNGYIEMLDRLYTEILSIDERNSVSEILNFLMTCKTEIQTKLNNISKWFRRSEGSFEGEYKLQVLADTSIEITKNIHPNFSFEINTKILENRNIKGEYHQHFIDLINNCLFNMIKHSHVESENLNAQLTINESDEKLLLNFENCVSNPNEHIEKLKKIKENWQSLDTNINQEGGTGFPKIKKIIFSDMNRKQSDFDFYVQEDNLTIKLSFETKDL